MPCRSKGGWTRRWPATAGPLELRPDYADAYINLGTALKNQGQTAEAITCYQHALDLKPDHHVAHSNLLYLLPFCPGYDARTLHEEHLRWNRQHAEPLAKCFEHHPNDRSADRRLRVGYVSPDFCNHVQSFFTVPLLSSHDHRQFEIFCYADVARPDALTARFQGHADVWRDVVGRTDDQVAQLVREDRIDILVDLTLHMARNRLLVFARKPAPVQVTFAGYPGTTGLSAIDYRLTDPYLDPPGLDDADYAEESVRLPDSFWCYDPLTDEPAVNSLPAQANGYVTFGCLNHFCKVNAGVLALWARVLRAVAGFASAPAGPRGSAPPRHPPAARAGGHRARPRGLRRARSRAGSTWSSTTASTWCSTRSPTTGTPPASTPSGWGCPWSRWWAGRRSAGRGCVSSRTSGCRSWSPTTPEEFVRIAVGAGRRPAAPERAPRHPAGPDAELAADGRPALRAGHRGRLSHHVATLVCQVVGRWARAHSDDTAVACDRRAPPLKAEFAEACNNPGNALRRQGPTCRDFP